MTNKPRQSDPDTPARPCPICATPVDLSAADAESYIPFCSTRCQQVDFFRWTEGRYAIVVPVSPEQLEEELSRRDEPE